MTKQKSGIAVLMTYPGTWRLSEHTSLKTIDFPAKPEIPSDETKWVKWYHHNLKRGDSVWEWGYTICRDTVSIVAINNHCRLALVTQNRYPYHDDPSDRLTEIVKGFIEDGEEPIAAAKRELEEELQKSAKQWTYLGIQAVAPGLCRIQQHLFVAGELSPTSGLVELDSQEELGIDWVDIKEFWRKVAQCEVIDAESIAAVQRSEIQEGTKLE